MAACAVVSMCALLLSRHTVTTAFENSRLVIKSTADYLLPSLLLSSTISAILISLATILVVIFISHKIAGPIYRFRKSAQSIAEGNMNFSIHIRKNDQLQPLASSMNEMLRSIRGRLLNIKKQTDDLKEDIITLNQAQRLALEEKINKIEENLKFFKF